jgi:signal transduction histidine kinase
MRNFAFVLTLLLSSISWSQFASVDDLIFKEIRNESRATNANLAKSAVFAEGAMWDSVLYYLSNHMEFNKVPSLLTHYHFLRGFSLFKKELYKQAEREFLKVDKRVSYYNFVRLRLADIAFVQGDYKKAYRKYGLVDTLKRDHLKYIERYDLYSSIGRVSYFLKKFNVSNKYMSLAEKLIDSKESSRNQALFYTDFANLYYEQYLDSLAMIYFEKAYNLANRSRDLSIKVLFTCNLAQVNLNGGNYEKSAKLFEKCKELTNEKYDIDKIWESSQLEKKLMLKVKQKEISNLANENRLRNLQRNVFVILAIFLFFILLMGYYQYRLNQKRAQVIFQQKEALNELNATKDQLFSVIGHDLRSSVNALRNGTRALEQSFESIDLIEARNQLEQNSIIASNTYSLLDNLLQWSLLQTNGGYFIQDEHRLSLLIDQVVYDYRGQLSQNSIEFVNEVPRAIRVWVDAESVKLILRNLMDNSIKFSKESGKISTYVQDETDKAVTLVWEDEGEGMSQETSNKLLTAKRLDRKEHEHTIGAGLGMQLVFSMIYRNGGTLDILSEVGKGTKMLITLLKK